MEEILFYVLVAISVIMSAVFIYFSNGQTNLRSMVLKAISSFLFTAIAVYACFLNFFILGTMLFLLGFVLSCFGDVILGLPDFPELKEKKNKAIVSGGMFFAAAHIAYYIAMIILFGWVWWTLLIAVLLALFFFLFTKLALKIDFGKMSSGIAFYSLFVSIVTSQGIYALFALNFSLYSILIAVGFLLFYVSDIVLMKIYFNNKESQNNRVLYYYNLGLYYAAQIIIATSLILVSAI